MTSKINEGATGAIQEELLAKAANKPVRRLYQIDYFSPGTGAIDWRSLGVEEPDHELFDVGWVDELRLSDCLRVQIPEHFTKERALAALRTIADVFEHKIEMGDPAESKETIHSRNATDDKTAHDDDQATKAFIEFLHAVQTIVLPEEEDGDRLFVKIPNNQNGPSLEALGLTLNESARGLVDDLYNRLTENERLTPEKWEFYNVWNALPGKYRYETETVVTNWAYTMLEVGAALAFQIAANPLLMLQAGSRHKI